MYKTTVIALALFAVLFTTCTLGDDAEKLHKEVKDSTVKIHKVTFNINGGNGAIPAEQTVKDGSAITLPNGNGFTRNGYTFGGWNTSANATGTNYNADSLYKPAGDITLYARWTISQYTITYDINGGSGMMPAVQTVDARSGVYIASGSGIYRNGYTFGGWNTNSNGTGTNYYANSWYTPTGNIFLYAKWTRNEYTITYNVNGGSGITPAVQTVDAGSSVYLASGSGIYRNGYTFGGWNTNSNGTGSNYNSGSWYTPAGDIALYARWIIGGIPSTPLNISASAASSSSITVSWSSVLEATFYYVYSNSTASGTYSYRGSSSTASFTDTGLSSNTTYYYKVSACNNSGESSQSSYTYATTGQRVTLRP